jgi:hypothetical protein
MAEQNQFFHYKLSFDDGKVIEFALEIDQATETFIPLIHQSPPVWSQLEYQQCENCPLSKEDTPHCPVAVNLMPLIELCSNLVSFESVKMELTTSERTVSHNNTTLQRVLSSILGLIMATTPCPHTEYLKPMARFHLPLASPEETIYRTTSMFLLAQYFRQKAGLNASLELDELTAIYQNLQVVNRALARRFRAAISEDATLNAIILLDLLSQSVTWSIEDGLEDLRFLFKRYGVD